MSLVTTGALFCVERWNEQVFAGRRRYNGEKTSVYRECRKEQWNQAPEEILAVLGPGLITGAADDDPSGISSYSVAGAAYGYTTLWIALLTFPLMAAIQLMCARLVWLQGAGWPQRCGFTIHAGCSGDPALFSSSQMSSTSRLISAV